VAEFSFAVEIREGKGKEFNRKLRQNGRVPAVVYARGKDTVSLSLDPRDLERSIKSSHAGMNTLFDLRGDPQVEGRTVLVKELQREPVRRNIIHADFFEIDMTQKLHVSVPLHIEGIAPGIAMGGVLEHSLREVELLCLPNAIPDEILVDVNGLEMNESIHLSDLQLPDGVEMLTDSTLSVVMVSLPKAEEEPVVEEDELAEGEEADAEKAEGEAGEAGGDAKAEKAEKAEKKDGD
jgi:large subunit ribosomal protein L25